MLPGNAAMAVNLLSPSCGYPARQVNIDAVPSVSPGQRRCRRTQAGVVSAQIKIDGP
jgi:hypothetical protein